MNGYGVPGALDRKRSRAVCLDPGRTGMRRVRPVVATRDSARPGVPPDGGPAIGTWRLELAERRLERAVRPGGWAGPPRDIASAGRRSACLRGSLAPLAVCRRVPGYGGGGGGDLGLPPPPPPFPPGPGARSLHPLPLSAPGPPRPPRVPPAA